MLSKPRHGWIIWLSLGCALLLAVWPLPEFLQMGRPLWPALFLAYWALEAPGRVGMLTAWLLGLLADVLLGTLLGQNALILTLSTGLILALQQRMRQFPLWQQSLVLLVVLGLCQLLQLWLNALVGNRPPTLVFLLPALVSGLLWPWVYLVLRFIQQRLKVS